MHTASFTLTLLVFVAANGTAAEPAKSIDFTRDIRSILSNACFTCHGPDDAELQGGLRLDSRASAFAEADSGAIAIVPGNPEESELVRRITSSDDSEQMPPADSGKKLTPAQIERLTEWIRQGAPYAEHWSYAKPVRPAVPDLQHVVNALDSPPADRDVILAWPKNEIDFFILDRLLREGMTPSTTADRRAIIRRLALDVTGLPPTWDEVQQFVNDGEPEAYERLVDRMLEKKSYGEHWARKWLDLARYADSAGYADDPPRIIWAYRDWVIRALNENKPFDQFTIEQIAGDLLPEPSSDQLIATAFHRNTLTNNEGGTNDEEFRNVAIVDRVNTTMAVWMGTTINCCQCHSHKYDPISQEEFYRLFAVFNNSQDADRRDESPLVEIWSEEQQRLKKSWQEEISQLEKTLVTPTAELAAAQTTWEQQFATELAWQTLKPAKVEVPEGLSATITDDGAVLVDKPDKTAVYTVDLPVDEAAAAFRSTAGDGQPALTALRIETLPHESLPGQGPGQAGGNFVITRVLASLVPSKDSRPSGRYIRVENPGKGKILSLAEVQVFQGSENLAPSGEVEQSSTGFNGPAKLAIDGNTNGDYNTAKSTTHTEIQDDPWWELDLKSNQIIDRIVIWNRTDNNLHTRLKDFRIAVLDEQRQTVWEQTITESPNPSAEYALSGVRGIPLAAAYADFSQSGFDASGVLDVKSPNAKGWGVGTGTGQAHQLTLVPNSPVEIAAGAKLQVTIEQLSQHENHTLGHFRVSATADAAVSENARTPAEILAILRTSSEVRTDAQREALEKYYLSIAPQLQEQRKQLAERTKQLADMKPETTVPVMRELAAGQQRTTNIQHRGNFLDKGAEVVAGVPAAFHPLDIDEQAVCDRLDLAQWLVDDDNPLTARVIANRYWEAIFGRGIVLTSEEFGSQGELPSHPQLLDWLATELVRLDWDMKAFVKVIVTSATYRQSSRVTPELLEEDPDNILLAHGPRFRLSAEMIRDQALYVSGLLSPKLYGPPVKPPQPKMGVNAAFGGGIDWSTSMGEDRYRRGLYTTWRRSSPYPSMATFDAPNREVCTIRRARTNTPLQALVTLNDPVYVEAAQALARRMDAAGDSASDKARFGFQACLAREPEDAELDQLLAVYEQAREAFASDPTKATQLATKPLGPVPDGSDVHDLAAWTVVGNVLLNLDEMFMKR